MFVLPCLCCHHVCVAVFAMPPCLLGFVFLLSNLQPLPSPVQGCVSVCARYSLIPASSRDDSVQLACVVISRMHCGGSLASS